MPRIQEEAEKEGSLWSKAHLQTKEEMGEKPGVYDESIAED